MRVISYLTFSIVRTEDGHEQLPVCQHPGPVLRGQRSTAGRHGPTSPGLLQHAVPQLLQPGYPGMSIVVLPATASCLTAGLRWAVQQHDGRRSSPSHGRRRAVPTGLILHLSLSQQTEVSGGPPGQVSLIVLTSLSLPPGLPRPHWAGQAMVPSPRPLSPPPMLAPANTRTAMWGVLRTSAPPPVGELLNLLAWEPASSHQTQTLRTVSPPPPSHRTPRARGAPPPAPPAPKRKTPNLHLHKSTPG